MVYDPTLGYDDAMPDAFNDWLGRRDVDDLFTIISKNKELNEKVEAWLWEYFAEHVYPYMNEVYEE